MIKNKLSITIDGLLSENVQSQAKRMNLSTSKLIENILSNWMKEQKRKEMIDGYKSMSDENLEYVQTYQPLSDEAWVNG